MSCDVTKFTISKGSDNTFAFTIKQDSSTLPLEIEPSDTFFADLIELGTGEPYTPVTGKELVVEDALNGKISLTITAAETDNGTDTALKSEKGSKVDRYYLRPTYKLILRCDTVNNGKFLAKVPEVYVD